MMEPASYLSFLIRLWRGAVPEEGRERPHWQGEIEHIQSGRRWTFDSLDELLGFVRQQTEKPETPGWTTME